MSTHHPHRRYRRGFTLVELLVVIGIIALLISVLMPALARARQAANLIDCQARLRQMGQSFYIYTASNKGLVPWGVVDHTAFWTDNSLPNASMQEGFWWWHFTLSEIMNKNLVGRDGFVHNLSPVFRDRDTVENPNEPNWVNHYTANPRIFYPNQKDLYPTLFGAGPEIQAQDRRQRKISSIKPSTVFLIWDGPQIEDQNYNSYGLAQALDGFGLDTTHAFCLGSPNVSLVYDRPVTPGWQGQNINGKALQAKYNIDLKQAFTLPFGWLSHLRFRHMKNTTLAALCLDGHVETRTVGTFMVKDICTNPY
jgi:prepilin-type N-terminal cleavage/methylation domain-containing protein